MCRRGLAASVCAGVLLAAGLVLMPFEASAQDEAKAAARSPDRKPGPSSGKAAGGALRKKAQVAGKADRKKNQANPEKGEGPTGPLPERPARVVTPPTMTPAELDRLIKQFLTATSRQGRAGHSHVRCRVRSPHLFRRDRASTDADAGRVLYSRPRQRQACQADRCLAREP